VADRGAASQCTGTHGYNQRHATEQRPDVAYHRQQRQDGEVVWRTVVEFAEDL